MDRLTLHSNTLPASTPDPQSSKRLQMTADDLPQLNSQTPQYDVRGVGTDTVEISAEGRAKAAQASLDDKGNEAMSELATRENEEGSSVERQIEKLKEQISEIQDQLNELGASDDEEAMAKRELLQAQLATLNGQMLDLLKQKMGS